MSSVNQIVLNDQLIPNAKKMASDDLPMTSCSAASPFLFEFGSLSILDHFSMPTLTLPSVRHLQAGPLGDSRPQNCWLRTMWLSVELDSTCLPTAFPFLLTIERPRVHPTGRILPVEWLDIAPITPKIICWGYQNFFFQFNAGISTAFFAKFCSDVRRNTYCEC